MRFAAALLKANDWCATLDHERVAGSKTVDNWSWETLPVKYFGDLKPARMGMNISVVSEYPNGACSVKLEGKGAYPMTFAAFLTPASVEQIVTDIPDIEAAAAILETHQDKARSTLESLR